MPLDVSGVRRFLLPDLGEGLTEAEIVAWHVAPGDEVGLNQVLVEVETEKAVVELPSPYAGTVVELLAAAGETVDVGAAIIAIDVAATAEGVPEEMVPMLTGYGPAAEPASRRRRSGRAHRDRTVSAPKEGGSRPLAAPPVRFVARQQGVDLADVAGHGPDGIITREDLAAHMADGPVPRPSRDGPGRESRSPVHGVQKHMAEAMVRSVATAPQACVFLTVDVTPTVELVERLRQNRHFEGVRVTPLAVVARAVVLALRDHPALNSSWDDTSAEVVTKHYVNLGVAVAGPLGLVVPNVKDAHDLTLRDLIRALADLTGRARDGALHARRPRWRHHHDHQHRRLRGGRRRADPQPRGGRHSCRRGRPTTSVGVRWRGGAARRRHDERRLRPPRRRRAGGLTLPGGRRRDPLRSHEPHRHRLTPRPSGEASLE